jgi:hypothetical protein
MGGKGLKTHGSDTRLPVVAGPIARRGYGSERQVPRRQNASEAAAAIEAATSLRLQAGSAESQVMGKSCWRITHENLVMVINFMN